MRFQELVILLPCHSLEDFPVYSEGEEAAGLLAAWTSLWHPALIHSAQAMPTWSRMDDPPADVEGRLLVIPPVSHAELPTGFFQRVKESGGCPVRRKQTREEILEAAFEALEDPASFDEAWVDELFALSFAYLQVQILTRQMRYSSNLDEVHFANQVVAAVNAAASGDMPLAEEKLTACYDLLSEERDLFYSVDSFLIDLVLLAPTTLGEGLQAELRSESPVNFLLTSGVLEALETDEHAETLAALRAAWKEGRVGVLACDEGEQPLPLLPIEAAGAAVTRGRDHALQVLERAPRVFGRRRYGLTPHLPQILRKLDMPAALHATLEDGRFPEGAQIKSQWEGADGSTVDAIAKAPLNASLPETFLGLALKTGESMDMDHVATLALAHWPGAASPFLNDLRRAARRSSALGKFVTVEEYFEDTDEPHHAEKFPVSLARSPYLRQAVVRRQAAPLSRWCQYQRARARWTTAQTMEVLADAIQRSSAGADHSSTIEALDRQCESASPESLAEQLSSAEAAAAAAVARAAAAVQRDGGDGKLIWNPHGSVRRMRISLEDFSSLPTRGGAVYAVDNTNGREAVVDVPPLGYLYVAPGNGQVDRREPLLAEDMMLRNEFFEATINPKSGGVASIQSYNVRGNRVSQQLAMRIPGKPGERTAYSTMVCDQLEVVEASRLTGAIRTRGRMMQDDELVARYEQVARVNRGSRVLELEIKLDEVQELKADPWNSYVASRIAWKDESSNVACDVNQTRLSAGDRKRLDAPHYVDIRNGQEAVTVFSLGLPCHRRIGLASLDTLLQVRNETASTFRLGLGIDIAHPLQEAIALAAPPLAAERSSAAPSTQSAWLFHLQARNVVATRWRLITDEGRVKGFEVRLLETAGRPAQVKLQSLRPLSAARVVDLRGETLSACEVTDGAARLELSSHEWAVVEAEWG